MKLGVGTRRSPTSCCAWWATRSTAAPTWASVCRRRAGSGRATSRVGTASGRGRPNGCGASRRTLWLRGAGQREGGVPASLELLPLRRVLLARGSGRPEDSGDLGASRDAFVRAAGLFGRPFEAVEIPYEGTTLPGHFYAVDASGEPRPTLIFHGGFDSTIEVLYFSGALAALRRGYNPTLVCEGERDHFFEGQPRKLQDALECPKTYARFTAEEGAEEHC